MRTKPGYQNPHFKPHRDLGAQTKSDDDYIALKNKVISYLQHADRTGRSTVSADELRALDVDFAVGNPDRDRLWNQISSDLGLTPTVVPDE